MTQVGYTLDDGTVVRFELDAGCAGFRPAGPDTVAGKLTEAVEPLIAGAKVLLDKVRDAYPDKVVVTFGVKVTGTTHWLIARAAAEGNFTITLTWNAEGQSS